jgi:hypothetical protein
MVVPLYTDLARRAEYKAIELLQTPVAVPPVPAVPIQEVRFYGRRRAPAFFAPFFLYYSTIRFRR